MGCKQKSKHTDTVYVNGRLGCDDNCGFCPECPKRTLIAAFETGSSVIKLAAGSYFPPSKINGRTVELIGINKTQRRKIRVTSVPVTAEDKSNMTFEVDFPELITPGSFLARSPVTEVSGNQVTLSSPWSYSLGDVLDLNSSNVEIRISEDSTWKNSFIEVSNIEIRTEVAAKIKMVKSRLEATRSSVVGFSEISLVNSSLDLNLGFWKVESLLASKGSNLSLFGVVYYRQTQELAYTFQMHHSGVVFESFTPGNPEFFGSSATPGRMRIEKCSVTVKFAEIPIPVLVQANTSLECVSIPPVPETEISFGGLKSDMGTLLFKGFIGIAGGLTAIQSSGTNFLNVDSDLQVAATRNLCELTGCNFGTKTSSKFTAVSSIEGCRFVLKSTRIYGDMEYTHLAPSLALYNFELDGNSHVDVFGPNILNFQNAITANLRYKTPLGDQDYPIETNFLQNRSNVQGQGELSSFNTTFFGVEKI